MALAPGRDTHEVADDPSSIQGRAAADLHFIRQTMERSATFTAVPGMGGAAMGSIGLIAAGIAAAQPSAERWLMTWLAAAAIALVVGLVTMRHKAAGRESPGAARRPEALASAWRRRSSPAPR